MSTTDTAELSPPAGETGKRLARIVALADQVFGDAAEARIWLDAPHQLLGATKPIELARTDIGARQVERLLRNIEYDLPA